MEDHKITDNGFIPSDEIEETVLPDNDSKKEQAAEDTVAFTALQAAADNGESDTATDNGDITGTSAANGDESTENTDKPSLTAKGAVNTAYDMFANAGEFFCRVIAGLFMIPGYLIAKGAVFIWKHTALFRDALFRIIKEIGNFFLSPLFKSKRALSRTNKQIKAAKEQGDSKKAARLYGSIAKNAVFGKQGLAVTLFNYAAPIIAIVFLMSVVGYATGTSYAIKLSIDGKFVGYVESEQVFNDAERIMQERITYIGNEKQIKMEPSYTLEMLGDQSCLNKYQLANLMLQMSDTPIEYAYGMYIDGKFYGALVDNTEIIAELDRILDGYRTDSKDEDVAFVKDITYVPGLYLSDSIVSTEEIKTLINSKKVEASYYTVQDGDSHLGICAKLGLTLDELEALNPGINDEDYMLRAGDKILKTQEVPFLSVSISRTESYDVDVPYDTEYVADDTRYQGVETVTQEGEVGTNKITAKVYYVNGEEVKRTIIKTERVKDPVTEIIAQGTLPPQSSHYSDASIDTGKKYIWPVENGTFWEWGWWDGGYAGHRGVDIGAPYGSDVYAGASGTVIFAGWDSGGLGYAVMILHPDGYTTVYAHNSELFVYAGQEVTQGECIAAIGETGLAYGCHCHFEVRYGSERLNPRYYLSGLPDLGY